MISRAVILALANVLLTTFAQSNPSNPTIDLGYVRYRGIHNTNYSTNEFFGIRFAQAPTGALRWKAPLPISTSPRQANETVNATIPGPICVQGFPYWTNPNVTLPEGSEDCLVLNVMQPANATRNSKLPVLTTIHGGGYTLGNADLASVQPMMQHAKNPFVFVSVQYRLGAFGFIGSQKYVKDGGDTNVGLLDQRLALEWIQQNIAAFGGDPKKVTIIGGSAGGGSVTSQMIMHGGVKDPPFRAAIAQFPWWQQHLRDEQLEQQYQYLLDATKCPDLGCVKSLSEDVLIAATQATYVKAYANGAYGYGSFYYGPYVDGSIIQDLPSREFRVGHFTKVPTLVDRAGYEGYSFTNLSLTTVEQEAADFGTQFKYATQRFANGINRNYPSDNFNGTFWRREAWFGDFSIDCPTYYIALSLSTRDIPVYKLVFNAGMQTHAAIAPFLSDPSLFPGLAPGYNATLAKVIKDWYISFAIHLDPNAQSWSDVKKPQWPDYKAESGIVSVNYTELGAVSDKYFDRNERCNFMWENEDLVQN